MQNIGADVIITWKWEITLAHFQINNGLGTIQDADDGAVDGRTTFAVTCNTAGTAWESAGVPITQVECATGM